MGEFHEDTSLKIDVAVLKEKVKQLEEREKPHLQATEANSRNIVEVDKKVIKYSTIISTILALTVNIVPLILKYFAGGG